MCAECLHHRFGMLDAAGRISYVQFLNAVHDEPTLAPSRLGSRLSKREASRLGSYPERAASLLSPAAAENLLRTQVLANTDTLLKVPYPTLPYEYLRAFAQYAYILYS